MDPDLDVLVEWDDHSQNVVILKDLVIEDGSELKKGARVRMWWIDKTWWNGTVITFEGEVESDSDDDLPLSHILKKTRTSCEELINLEKGLEEYDDDRGEDYMPSSDSEHSSAVFEPNCCRRLNCKREIFASCPQCLTMMCHDHFIEECTLCKTQSVSTTVEEGKITNKEPENYIIDGEPRVHVEIIEAPSPKKSRRALVKEGRNKGLPYASEKSGNFVPARNQLGDRCNSASCERRGLSCKSLTENRRSVILKAYYDMPSLAEKRRWLTTHVVVTAPFRTTVHQDVRSRKSRTLHYYLPGETGELVQICRMMFLATTGISERQIRTALQKMTTEGVMDDEKRGGRHALVKERDNLIRELCKIHINRFPRTESHYCRATSRFEYLSGDLTVSKMYEMFRKDTGRIDISLATYYRVFKGMKLKFVRLKKDMCGLCEVFRTSGEEEKKRLEDKYMGHIAEKNAVRKLKEMIKSADDPSHILASFDLQQLIYLPKSNRCEVFYKRRLSNYNFTVCNIKDKKVQCYLWHEGIAARGANEIASHVHNFLHKSDTIGVKGVSFFADGCSGQNKNSILPAMLLKFVQTSTYIQEITLYFFETSHGQNEGDAVHSTIERALKRAGEILLPSQLSTLIRMARRDPYSVTEVCTQDIQDWKAFSQQLGVLRVRISEEGDQIDWTNIMQLRVKKGEHMKLFFKLSHIQPLFSTLNLGGRRNSISEFIPERAYSSPPRLSVDKYSDLKSLCLSDTPVVRSPEARLFYANLSH
ncbi:hypothetical protein SNE40_004762 [Patella caerulea]|uniref:Uncharacterized protein n=3 Tax=Patella caerulea TaxID=87958 RepID=A0AAN8Q1C2_PATCE